MLDDWILLIPLVCIVIVIALIPVLCTVVLGTYLATKLGLSGLVWWAFVIIFYLLIIGVLGALTKIND